MHQEIIARFDSLKEKQLSIDITRGKPDKDQLDLSNDLIDLSIPISSEDGIDLRNYGEPFGIIEARRLGSELLNAPIENILAGEQSSLLLAYQTVLSNYLFADPIPWKDIKNPKFVCPVPGFDRHFMMLDDFGIEAVPIPLKEDGIDLLAFEEALKDDEDFVGILCVPKHSNPSGEIYSDDNLQRMFEIGSNYSNKFLFLFDHAYLIHDFLPTPEQKPLWQVVEESNVQDQTVVTTSFSKVTFGGGSISFMATSGHSMDLIKKVRTTMIICPDKINQKRHVEFFKDIKTIKLHMEKHAELIRPKFEMVYSCLDKLDKDCGTFSRPTGGYFITYSTSKPIASKVVELCKKLGVFITPAGATHPNKYDPEDSVIRIAPTYVSIDELKNAMDVFRTSVEIIHFEVDIQFVDTS
jgi:DNA-binding transcriptional MocR family regulator